jgi:hypothetical protein
VAAVERMDGGGHWKVETSVQLQKGPSKINNSLKVHYQRNEDTRVNKNYNEILSRNFDLTTTKYSCAGDPYMVSLCILVLI